jgi:hypothetical protein
MDSKDKELRRFYKENGPRVDLDLFKDQLGTRLPSRHGRRPGKRVRYVVAAVAMAAVVVGLGFGAQALVDRLTRPANILVITDTPSAAESPTTQPSTTQPSTTDPASASTTVATPTSTVPTSDAHGLWAGNVKTLPAKPSSLPDEFYEEPAHPAHLLTGEQLWVFADEVTPAQAAAAIDGAAAETTILVFDPSEELCQLLDILEPMRPGHVGQLPDLFTQTPVLCRETVFAETGPQWYLAWAQLSSDGARPAAGPDPRAVYAAASSQTMRLDHQHRDLQTDQQAQAATGGTTSTTDVYPIQKTLESAKAQILAQEALDYLETATGLDLQIESASENQMIGPNNVVEHKSHGAALVEPGTGRDLSYSVFWSNEDQSGGSADDGWSGCPVARFDAADGSRGYIQATFGYSCRLQLKNGVTAVVQTTSDSPLQLVAEASFLTAQQMIAFTEWLTGQADYLRPSSGL